MTTYVHGYSARESDRLSDQADALALLLHEGTSYPAGARVLEVGCGVGAQTVHLLRSSPYAHLTSVDVSADSLAQARARVGDTVSWVQGDLFDLPFADGSYDHVFVCFVLEHLPDPVAALRKLKRLLCTGGTITVIEGDHGSAIYHPPSAAAQAVIDAQVALQARAGGSALLGRSLQPLLRSAGYSDVAVTTRTVYADESRPGLVEGFTRNTFIALFAAVRSEAIQAGLITAQLWDAGMADLERTAEPGGTLHYAFFKALARAGR